MHYLRNDFSYLIFITKINQCSLNSGRVKSRLQLVISITVVFSQNVHMTTLASLLCYAANTAVRPIVTPLLGMKYFV